jgi:hypothetical protein
MPTAAPPQSFGRREDKVLFPWKFSSLRCDSAKLADEGAFGGCQHIGHLDLAADSGSKALAAAALESCSHHVAAHAVCQVASEALRRHLLVSQVHRRHRHHFRCQQARGRLDRPGRVL